MPFKSRLGVREADRTGSNCGMKSDCPAAVVNCPVSLADTQVLLSHTDSHTHTHTEEGVRDHIA